MAGDISRETMHSTSQAKPEVFNPSAGKPASSSLQPENGIAASPTDDSTLHRSTYSPTSGKEQSPTEIGALQDFPISPTSGDGLQKPYLTAAGAELDSKRTPSQQLSRPFRLVGISLQKVRLFRIPAVRRIWAQVANTPADALTGQIELTEPTWRTMLFRFEPLFGIFCMLAAIATMIASFGVLAGSNRGTVASWSAPPSMYLALFTAVANLGMRYACMQGVVIAWWVRALRGSTFAQLHHDWRSGTTLRGALATGRHTGLLSLACIVSTLVVIDGALFQRSSTVVEGPTPADAVLLNVTMAPELPTGWSGNWITGDELASR